MHLMLTFPNMDAVLEEKLESFFKKYKYQKYKKGEILIRADENPNGIFYLKEGIVKRYAISSHGEELVLNIYKPIAFFPISWVINHESTPHYFEALTPVTVWKAPSEDVEKFIKGNPDIIYDLLKRIYKGMNGLWMRMEFLMSGNAYARLITELIIIGRRFGVNEGGKVRVDLKVTEKDLASQTGIARETVSRMIQELRKKNLLEFANNKLTISNFKKLEEELQYK